MKFNHFEQSSIGTIHEGAYYSTAIIFFILSMFCGTPLSAQKNYVKGYVVTNNGDTIHGWIDYQNWLHNPVKINFKRLLEEGTVNEYGILHLKSFEIPGKDLYRRAIVTKDMRSVNVAQLSGNEDNNKTDTAFLRLVVKGPILNLFELFDFKPHFYIEENNETYQELLYQIYPAENNNSAFYKRNIFRQQLKKYALGNIDQASMLKAIERIDYNEGDLKSIVRKINGGDTRKNEISTTRKKTVAFFAGGGIAYSNIKFKGRNSNVVPLDFKGSVRPLLLAGFDIQSSRQLQRFILRVQLDYSTAAYEGEGFRDYGTVSKEPVAYSIKQKIISPSFGFLYNFYRSNQSKIYCGAAASYNFASTENTYTSTNQTSGIVRVEDNYIDFEKRWIGLNLKIGAFINNKFDITASGDVIRTLTNYSYFSGNGSCYALTVNYHF